ncbi:class I SAM-dependent methyltransferase [Marmoricola sp. URHA0025 HA25]
MHVVPLHRSYATVFAAALRGATCEVLGLGKEPRPLPVADWTREVDGGDLALLAECRGETLDVGCGPGRMTRALAERGHAVLGIDVVPEAVRMTRRRRAPALLRDVFDTVPGEGRWSTVLLADGNIGIGGDPRALLVRVRTLLGPGGRVVADLAAPGTGVVTRPIRLQTAAMRSRPFPWSVVGTDAVGTLAIAAGLTVTALHAHDDRRFAVLEKSR